jgi:cytochrome c peroxidase
MKLHRLTLCLAVALFVAACSNESVTPPPPKNTECPANAADCPAPTPLTIQVPAGYPEMPQPDDNPLTVEGVELGRLLFYDPILSGDSTQACGSCHLQERSFADSRPFSEGIRGLFGNRHAPVIVNPAWTGDTFWDGRALGLEDQATKPVPNEIEMDLPWTEALKRLKRHPTYPEKFCAAFGTDCITQKRVVKAIAQFERTFISFNAKYDKVKRGEDTFTPEEFAGYRIFTTEIGDCFHCHMEPLFATPGKFANTGLDSVVVDRGRFDVTGNPADMGQFKAPTLRNVTERHTFMHDSRFTNLKEVIDHYNLGFHDGDLVDPLIRARIPNPNVPPGLRRRLMREGEIDTLIIFLNTLTDSDFLTNPDLSNPYR